MSGCGPILLCCRGFVGCLGLVVIVVFLGGEVFDFLFSFFFFSNWRRKPKFLVNINFLF